MTVHRPRRSALYLPASNARAIEKARTLACDVVILDLEDAVGPDDKALAREQAVAAAKAGGFGPRELVIRVNGLDTPWGAEDLAAVRAAAPDAILVPKVSWPEDFAAYAGGPPLWAMIETCAAILRLDALGLASAAGGAPVWVMGTNDLAKEMRAVQTPEREALAAALSLSVIAARAHGLAVLDGVHNDIADTEGFAGQCAQAARLGFDGKTLIHPSQIDPANHAFTPVPGAVEWARMVVAAFAEPANAGKGVIKLEGRMVERLHLEEARRLMALADDIALRGQGAG